MVLGLPRDLQSSWAPSALVPGKCGDHEVICVPNHLKSGGKHLQVMQAVRRAWPASSLDLQATFASQGLVQGWLKKGFCPNWGHLSLPQTRQSSPMVLRQQMGALCHPLWSQGCNQKLHLQLTEDSMVPSQVDRDRRLPAAYPHNMWMGAEWRYQKVGCPWNFPILLLLLPWYENKSLLSYHWYISVYTFHRNLLLPQNHKLWHSREEYSTIKFWKQLFTSLQDLIFGVHTQRCKGVYQKQTQQELSVHILVVQGF